MSNRDAYPPGVPCWVTCLADDIPATTDFYGRLFGWSFDLSPDGRYGVALLRGREVAGIGSRGAAGEDVPCSWMTEVRVDDARTTGELAVAAGGRVLAGPMDIAPAGRLTVLQDPTGGVLCGFEPEARPGARTVNEPNAYAMSLLRTPDPARAARFYDAVFGWQAEAFGPVELFRLPGYVGGEEQQPVPRDVVAGLLATPEEAPVWTVDFWVDDAERAAQVAHEAGGAVVEEPHAEGLFRRTVLRDPGGARFTASQLVLSPQR